MVYPPYYRGFWGYYSYGWPSVYDPGYLSNDTIVSVETNLYSLTGDSLVWSGVTQTFNPQDVADTIDEIVDAVSGELRREGLLN